MNAVISYKGRVWTCNYHHLVITSYLENGLEDSAKKTLHGVHPKKGNQCAECARLYDETPPSNR